MTVVLTEHLTLPLDSQLIRQPSKHATGNTWSISTFHPQIFFCLTRESDGQKAGGKAQYIWIQLNCALIIQKNCNTFVSDYLPMIFLS